MALNTSKCNHPTPLPFKGLIGIRRTVCGFVLQNFQSVDVQAEQCDRITSHCWR